MTTPRQQTIGAAREVEGVGLQTGEQVRVRLIPAPVNTGVVFRLSGQEGAEVPATLASVTGTDRGVTLGTGSAQVHTAEHFLSAVSAHEVDNLYVELAGNELPAADGSSRMWDALLRDAGREEQDAPARVIDVTEPFSVQEGASSYVVAPSETFTVATTIEFDHPLIGRQFGSYRVDRESWSSEIAAARTFGFAHEVKALHARGRARGGSLENAVVLDGDGLMEGVELRYPDEFVRHKTLDLIGDLALLGARLRMQVIAERPSHQGNLALARELLSRFERRALARPILDVQQILQYLPHRYPFLLVDRVVEYEERRRIVGLKNVTINEPFFVGHFPGHPIMPGVLIIEAMAQVGGLLVMDTIDEPQDKVVYFMSLDNVKWRRPVVPGDQIRFEVEVLQIRRGTCRMRGVGRVDGHVVAEAEMMARVMDR
jgi:UDP-3-O-[3-hydroxymyristoyl] N-acetylglucosamine deacetylase / 3-hydroxyacyl-[acyl-carrier-protein] dehydratase